MLQSSNKTSEESRDLKTHVQETTDIRSENGGERDLVVDAKVARRLSTTTKKQDSLAKEGE